MARKKHIGIDATTMLVRQKNGWQNYTEALVREIARSANIQSELAIHFYFHTGNPFCDPTLLKDYISLLPTGSYRIYRPGRGYYALLPIWAMLDRLDWLHLPVSARLRARPCKILTTVHDVCARRMLEEGERVAFTQAKADAVTIQQATAFLTDSQCSKQDLIRLYAIPEDRIWVTHLGVDAGFYPGSDDVTQVKHKYGLTQYILYVSALQYRKNHVRLIQAFEALRRKLDKPYQLVLVGYDGPGAAEIHAAIRTSQFARDIIVLGYVPQAELRPLYAGCDLFVYPSLCEGFGLPILEAMACGVPVVASNATSVPEVCGNAALLFDPYNVDDMAVKIGKGLENPSLRNTLRDQGFARYEMFSWSATATRTLEVYRELSR